MRHLPHRLAEIAGKVLETDAGRRTWTLGNPFAGHEVNGKNRLHELTASFYFVLPRLAANGRTLNLLTIARGLGGDSSGPPEFLDPAALSDVGGGVYLHVTYDPSRSRFEARMNAGSEVRELLGVVLKGAPPEQVCGRLLELYVEIDEDRMFASVNDRFAGGHVELGDFALDGIAPSTGEAGRPWGASPAGLWWVVSGLPVEDEPSSRLPSGFGLSDLRIALGSASDDAMGSLAYSGALDHLVPARPVEAPKPVPEWEVRALLRHAESLRAMADDLDRIRLLLPVPCCGPLFPHPQGDGEPEAAA